MNGIVTFYHPTRCYGFIEDSSGTRYFFLNRKNEKHLIRAFYQIGDEVLFEEVLGAGKKSARIIEFIGNRKYQELIEQVKVDPVVEGILEELYSSKFAIKHIPSQISIPLKGPLAFEDDLIELYYDRINQKVKAIVSIGKQNRPTAVLSDRQFIPGYYEAKKVLESGEVIEGRISGLNEEIVFVVILNPAITGFIRRKNFPLVNFKNGDIIKVRIVNISETHVQLEYICQK